MTLPNNRLIVRRITTQIISPEVPEVNWFRPERRTGKQTDRLWQIFHIVNQRKGVEFREDD